MRKAISTPVVCLVIVAMTVVPLVGMGSTTMAAPASQAATTPTPMLGQGAQPDVRTSQAADVSAANTAPQATDEEFVADTGGYLDQYLFRKDVLDEKLTFKIPITRYYSNQMKFDGDGFLTNYYELINEGILPSTVVLTLRIWDVDHDSLYDGNGDGIPDPEVDYVYVNGHLVVDSQGRPKKLTSGNNTWSVWSVEIPMQWLKFPQSKGTTSTSPAEALNRVAIDIDVPATGYWAVKCDWGSLKIETGPRPVVLVHGFQLQGGLADGRTSWSKWYNFQTGEGWLTDHLIPASAVRLGGWDSYEYNAALLAAHIAGIKNEYGVDKVHIVAHSKGGIDSRAYLGGHNDVELLVQIGSPNSGAQVANLFFSAGIGLGPIGFIIAEPALTQLTTGYMALWNLFHGDNRNTTYVSYAGNYDEVGLCAGSCILTGRDDNLIRVDEVHALSYAYAKPLYSTNHPNTESKHGELIKSWWVFTEVLGWLKNPPQRSASSWATSTPLQLASSEEDQRTELQSGTISTGEVKSATIVVDAYDRMSLSLIWGEGNLNLVVFSPSGQRIDPTVAAGNSDIDYVEDAPMEGMKVKSYAFNAPETGTWTMQVEAVQGANEEEYLVFGTLVGSDVSLSLATDEPFYRQGDDIVIIATLLNDGTPITGATASAIVEKPDDTTTSLVLYDDGSHGDAQGGDGIYTNTFSDTASGGTYSIVVSASGSAGASGSFSRSDSTVVTVSSSATRMNSTFTDYGSDTDADGLFNYLITSVGIDVAEAGDYVVTGSLVDTNGKEIQRVSQIGYLSAGSQTLQLAFDGNAIYFNRVDGPYYLRDVYLAESTSDGPLPVDSQSTAYTTSYYAYTAFQRPLILLTGNGSDFGYDEDGDGFYDWLYVGLETEVATSGSYNFNAQLIDRRGGTIVWSTGSAYLSGTQDLWLVFDGSKIATHAINGPYVVTDLSVSQTSGGSAFATFGDIYTTQPYSRVEFGGNYFMIYLPTVSKASQ